MSSSSTVPYKYMGGGGYGTGHGHGGPAAQAFGMPPVAPASASSAGYCSQAVSRSDEFLSCARTAVKLARRRNQQQQQQQHNLEGEGQQESSSWWSVDVDHLRLHDAASALGGANPFLEGSIELLRGMHAELQALEGLVRRRGHTNDPTEEIQGCTDRLQRDTQELLDALDRVVPRSARGQARRHYQLVSDWIKGAAQEQGGRLQQVLKTRAAVLAEQAQRRKMFTASSSATRTTMASAAFPSSSPGTNGGAAMPLSSASSAALSRSNPLFTIPVPAKPNPLLPRMPMQSSSASAGGAPAALHHHSSTPNQLNGGNSSSSGYSNARGGSAAAPSSGYGPGGVSHVRPAYSTGSYYGYGYGNPHGASSGNGSTSLVATSGMRQRRPGAAASAASQQDSSSSQQQEQERLLVRQQERQAQERLREARQAESSLVELGTLFGKMSHLISAQGETVAKIEDDVEAAMLDVQAGHGEIQTLYGIKKGNRGLILKTFGLLIFFIVFMRLYKSK